MSNPLPQISIILNLKIRKWSGEVSDSKALGIVAQHFKGDTSQDKYRKSLFVSDPLAIIDKCAGRIRLNFYRWTMAWLDAGNGRLVSSMDYREFATEHRRLVNDFEQAVDTFIQAYPEHCDLARERKGDLYQESEYPTQADLRNRFGIELTTLPFPSTADFRIEAPEEVIAELKSGMDQSIRTVSDTLARDIGIRMLERIKFIHLALVSGKRWSKTLFEELQFVARMGLHMGQVLPPALTEVLALVQDKILIYEPKKLRHSETQQKDCVSQCEEAIKKLEAIA